MIAAFIALPLLLAPVPLCTAEEYAAYEAQGFDAYECDGDALMRVEDSIAQAVENNRIERTPAGVAAP